MFRTEAPVRAVLVDALTSPARLGVGALVHVRAVGAGRIEPEALVAFAPEAAQPVLADAVEAHVVAAVEQGTLVNVHAGLAVVLGRVHEAPLAVAHEGALGVDAGPVLAQGGVVGALVDVGARLAVAAEPGVADAQRAAGGVDALGPRVAASVVDPTLVDILPEHSKDCKSPSKRSHSMHDDLGSGLTWQSKPSPAKPSLQTHS